MSFWKTYIPDFSQPKHADKKFTFLKMPTSDEVCNEHFKKYYLDVDRNEFDAKFITKVMNECNLEPVTKLVEITQERVTTAKALLKKAVGYFEAPETFDYFSAESLLNEVKEYLGGAAEYAFKFKVHADIHMSLHLGDKEQMIACIGTAMWLNRMYSYFVGVARFIERRYKLAETVWD